MTFGETYAYGYAYGEEMGCVEYGQNWARVRYKRDKKENCL
jgi:hypothetical protein